MSVFYFAGMIGDEITQYRVSTPPKTLQLANKQLPNVPVTFYFTLNLVLSFSSTFNITLGCPKYVSV